MYDGEQLVSVKWNNTNKEWYSSKGYIFTKRYQSFEVMAKDLKPGSSAKINVICDYCGNEYKTQFALVNNGRKVIQKDCCPKCTGKKTSEVSLKRRSHKYFEQLSQVCDKYGYILLTGEDDYTDLHSKINYICPIHGEKSALIDNLLHGHRCPECSYTDRFDNIRLPIEYINSIVLSKGDVWLNPSEYKNSVIRNLHIKCACGNEYVTSFTNFYRAGVTRCQTCSTEESNGEVIIRTFLENHNIRFDFNKRFEDCRDVKPMPFDFYLPDYNMCIEFDGQHHYFDIPNRSNLDIVQRHDKMKDQYCAEHGIRMIRIPYYKGSNIEEILSKELKL